MHFSRASPLLVRETQRGGNVGTFIVNERRLVSIAVVFDVLNVPERFNVVGFVGRGNVATHGTTQRADNVPYQERTDGNENQSNDGIGVHALVRGRHEVQGHRRRRLGVV